jgi:hypothetical protein
MTDWMRFPSGQYNLIKEEHPKRVAWVRKSPQGWDWIIQDVTGRQIDRGTSKTASKARARAAGWIASEGLSDQQLERLQQERRDAGFSDDEII